jgi:hypothetical protein
MASDLKRRMEGAVMGKADAAADGKDEEMATLIKAEMKRFLDRTKEGGMAAKVAATAELEAEYVKAVEAERRADDLKRFQELRAERDNDIELAWDLYQQLLNKRRSLPTAEQMQHAQPKTSGRPARRWGPRGEAKPPLVKVIDAVKEIMRDEGIAKPKIKDAIAHARGIPKNERHRPKHKKSIDDVASVYSRGRSLNLKEK